MNCQAIAESIIECSESLGGFDVMNYSGRGMYGEYCLAVTGDVFRIACTLMEFACRRNDHDLRVFLEINSPWEDSLRYDNVLYWKSLPPIAKNGDETEEEEN